MGIFRRRRPEPVAPVEDASSDRSMLFTYTIISDAERARFEGPIDVSLRGREARIAVHVLRRP